MDVREYCESNRKWLQKLAQSGDPVVRAMALAILELGSERQN